MGSGQEAGAGTGGRRGLGGRLSQTVAAKQTGTGKGDGQDWQRLDLAAGVQAGRESVVGLGWSGG